MEKLYLKMVLDCEEHVNKIVEVLALSPASHYTVNYSSAEISITAFARDKDDAQQVENLIRTFAWSADKIEMRAHENDNQKFWAISLTIPF